LTLFRHGGKEEEGKEGKEGRREGGKEAQWQYPGVDHGMEEGEGQEADTRPRVPVVVGGGEGQHKLEDASAVHGPSDEGHAVPGAEKRGGRRGGGGGGGGGGRRGRMGGGEKVHT